MNATKAFEIGFQQVKSYIDGALDRLVDRLDALERRAPERGEAGKDGRDGADGRDGKDGVDGRDAEPVSDEQIAAAVERYLIANPPAAGKDGADGKDGEKGETGNDGKDGADGIGLAGAMIDRDGELNVTLTNGEVRKLGPVVGRDGKNGDRGEAGFSLTDFNTDWRPEDKVLILSWDAGEDRYSHELFVPYVRDMGVWAEGKSYLKGDGVTWGGSFWIAQDDTAEKPDGSKAWRLAVKKGRDGKDFAGPQPKAAEKVRI